MPKIKIVFYFLVFLVSFFLFTSNASAHQPRIAVNNVTNVSNPEISQAFYGVLSGKPDYYIIDSPQSFNLYANILVPVSSNPNGRYSVQISDISSGKEVLIGKIDGNSTPWKEFYEEFAGDNYFQGPEFHQQVPAGKYSLKVFSESNQGKYVLAIGEKEVFGLNSVASVFTILPQLKLNFFNSPITTLLTAKLGIVAIFGILIALVILIFIWKLFYFLLIKFTAKKLVKKLKPNLNKNERILRFFIALIFLLIAVWYWNIVLFIISSFFFFEAFFKWCFLKLLIGKK